MNGRYIAAVIAAITITVLVGWANYAQSSQTYRAFHRFQQSICALSAQQGESSHGFVRLLETLKQRANEREVVDTRAGNATAAQADADSAELYTSVLASYQTAPKAPISLDCP